MRRRPRQAATPSRVIRVRAAAGPPDAESPWVHLRSARDHPHIFARMIRAADSAAAPGEVVNVYDKAGRLLGRGLYNPRSQIALRMLTWGDEPVDERFWRDRLDRALSLRRRLNLDAATDAYRLVHAEGDGLSGLIAERYADCLVFEVFSLGIFQRIDPIGAVLADLLGRPASLDRPTRAADRWRIVVRADEAIQRIEGFRAETPPVVDASTVTIREHGVRYRVDLAHGHKTGFFCDQRDNRRRFASLCAEASVLDLCCYTAGFGLSAALLGRAAEVTCVDLDEDAIALARENVNLNNTRINLVHADAFSYLRQLIANGRMFDAVVLDPPKFAPTRTDVDDALRKYHDLNALAMRVVRRGGILLTCSCSGLVSRSEFVETLHRAARPARRGVQMFDLTGAAPDHPVMLDCPESVYLKAAWLRIL